MPSGGITITPGKILGATEEVSNAKLNQGFRPVGRIDEGAITTRELAATLNSVLNAVRGKNLLCNGNFQLWDYFPGGAPTESIIGAYPGGREHDYGSANRWVMANDANRTVAGMFFNEGQTDVPDFPFNFLRWTQGAPVAVDPSYFGQRIENVSSLASRTLTLSIWARPGATLTVTPEARQFFGNGFGASLAVLTTIDAVELPGNEWTQITATFELPAVSGKTITTGNFTEFRIDVPQDVDFEIDWAHAQLEVGDAATGFEERMIHEEFVYAMRYYEVMGMMLSTDVTIVKPFVRAIFPKIDGTTPTMVAASGTGATIASGALDNRFAFQDTDHSEVAPAAITFDGELHAE